MIQNQSLPLVENVSSKLLISINKLIFFWIWVFTFIECYTSAYRTFYIGTKVNIFFIINSLQLLLPTFQLLSQVEKKNLQTKNRLHSFATLAQPKRKAGNLFFIISSKLLHFVSSKLPHAACGRMDKYLFLERNSPQSQLKIIRLTK